MESVHVAEWSDLFKQQKFNVCSGFAVNGSDHFIDDFVLDNATMEALNGTSALNYYDYLELTAAASSFLER